MWGADTGVSRGAANQTRFTNGSTGGGSADIPGSNSDNGQTNLIDSISENLTLSVAGAATTSTIQIPANSFVLAVDGRVTTAIAGVDAGTRWALGDVTTTTRFTAATGAQAIDSTLVGINHLQGSVATDATGPIYTSATAIQVTLSGGVDNTPSGGVIRITARYITFGAATS